MPLEPHQFWQSFAAPETYAIGPAEGHGGGFPASMPDGSQLLLPIRILPGDGNEAVASLIINQASFVVEDAISQALAAMLMPYEPQVVIGVPTLGLPLANNVARRLEHGRMVALGTSRKFWYRDDLSAPMSSITSPTHQKTIYLDPRSLPLLQGKRAVVIDDVISSGTSMVAVLTLLAQAGIQPAAIGAAMLQGTRWQEPLAAWRDHILAPLRSPRLKKTGSGGWLPRD